VDVLEREAVLASLDDELSESLADRGRTVLVTGEAGIGKSTVVREFLSAHADVRTAVGHCDPVAAARSLGPILDLAAALGTQRLYSWGGETSRRSNVNAFHQALIAKPTIAVVEDAHWADNATLDAIVHLARRIDQHPVLLIVTYRSDEVGPDHSLRLMIGRLASLRLRRLALARPSVDCMRTIGASEGGGVGPEALPELTREGAFAVSEVSVLDSYSYDLAN
jgi:predicted ATPase